MIIVVGGDNGITRQTRNNCSKKGASGECSQVQRKLGTLIENILRVNSQMWCKRLGYETVRGELVDMVPPVEFFYRVRHTDGLFFDYSRAEEIRILDDYHTI